MGTLSNNVKITIGKGKKMCYNPWIAGAGIQENILDSGFINGRAECGKRECDK